MRFIPDDLGPMGFAAIMAGVFALGYLVIELVQRAGA